MPFKSDSMKIGNEKLDRRVKLTLEQKEEIKELYKTGNFSLRKLGTMYKVDKRTIQFIINPEKYEIAKQQRKERGKDGRYYDREYHNEKTKEHRRYKNNLYKDGKLNEEKES